VVSIEVFSATSSRADRVDLRLQQHAVRDAVSCLCGAYTLAASGTLRADFVYIYMKPRGQAALDLALYFLFFIRASWADLRGYDYAALSGESVSTRR